MALAIALLTFGELVTLAIVVGLYGKVRHMTTDADLTAVEQRFAAAVASVKTEIANLTASLQAAATGDGLTADQAAAHVATLQGLATQLEALEAPAAPAAPASGT